jgi:hypothetical protein
MGEIKSLNMEYTLFWLTGDSEIVKGDSPSQAMTLAGYSNGALRALDFWHPDDVRDQYEWDAQKRTWNKKTILNEK